MDYSMRMTKSVYILGISAYFHDSAAALVKNGEIIVAIQEERLSRKKQDDRLPVKAINFCLREAGITIEDIDVIAYYEKPFLKLERLLETQVWQYPYAFLPFRKTVKNWFKDKLWVPSNIRKATGFKGQIYFTEHHEAHAAATCYTSPFKEAVYLTIDGIGEWTSSSFGIFENNKIQPLSEQTYPHSVGFLYSAFTQYCGFKVNSGEYKLMGLAPYGKPIFKDMIKEKLVHINDDGSIELELAYFQFHRGLKMINKRFEMLLGKPARKSEGQITQHYMDVAASIQEILEEIVLKTASHIKAITRQKNLCYGGGVALNCRANQLLLEKGIFDDIHIYSASGDAGGAIGAALSAWNHNTERQIINPPPYLGRSFKNEEIIPTLEEFHATYTELSWDKLYQLVAKYLAGNKVIGWFQGKDEMGPRALGNRSILASPLDEEMRIKVNRSIKFREEFRPFAPVILEDKCNNYFENVRHGNEMLYTYYAKTDEIPACVHVDKTARVQTVTEEQNEKLHSLIQHFEQLTSTPVLINTSFNRRGEPMVHSPEDALRTFVYSELDYLILNNILLSKNDVLNSTIKEMKYELD